MSRDIIRSSKVCFKCGEAKPRNEFYKHSEMADGLLGKCKECTKKDVTEHRLKNLEKVREYDKTRARLPHRVAQQLRLQTVRRKKDKRKDACHGKVARAIRAGVIKWKPCCVCLSEKSLAHHESYDRPFDVVWYCQAHHVQRHKEMKVEGVVP